MSVLYTEPEYKTEKGGMVDTFSFQASSYG